MLACTYCIMYKSKHPIYVWVSRTRKNNVDTYEQGHSSVVGSDITTTGTATTSRCDPST